MHKQAAVLSLMVLILVSCASPGPVERAQDSPGGPDEKAEQDIPSAVQQLGRVHVKEVRRYLWVNDEVTLAFITTNSFEGAPLGLLTSFPRRARAKAHAYLDLGIGKDLTRYELSLGSPFCRRLADSLTFYAPSAITNSNYYSDVLMPERVGKLRELLRGDCTYKSPPP